MNNPAIPLPNTWVNIQEIAKPNHVSEKTAAHFHFCHIRPTIGQSYYYKGSSVRVQSEGACVIVGSQGDAYLVATRQGTARDFTAADATKFSSSFKWFSLSHSNFFQGPWQVYFFKSNLLHVP